ncbi:hypothetical protein QJQ45_017095 [Haematococcus lacustris]|nr:hypothetical protein QJQ45_017095 [Haematococcus lacustris]
MNMMPRVNVEMGTELASAARPPATTRPCNGYLFDPRRSTTCPSFIKVATKSATATKDSSSEMGALRPSISKQFHDALSNKHCIAVPCGLRKSVKAGYPPPSTKCDVSATPWVPRPQRSRLVVVASGPAGGMGASTAAGGRQPDSLPAKLLVGTAVAYITLMVLIPFANVFYQAFHKGFHVFLEHLMDPDFLHAAKLTLQLAAVSVPVNVLFGLMAAINITRNEFPGKVLLLSVLDLPFSISPVVTGLMLTLLYGRNGWFGPLLQQAGVNVVFAFTGMALATMFVTLPFVVRELIPILETIDLSQEEAARTLGANDWQVFWNVTLPNIRQALRSTSPAATPGWQLNQAGGTTTTTTTTTTVTQHNKRPVLLCRTQSVLMAKPIVPARDVGGNARIWWGLLYGTILTNARAMGEFGAVSVISGNILGKTQTLTLFVESAYKEYNTEAAFAAAVLLSSLALFTLFIKDKVEAAAAAETRK